MGVQAGGFDKGEDGGLMKLTAKSTAGFIFSLSIGSGGGFPGGSLVKNPPAKQETHSDLSDGKIPWRRQWHPLQYSCLGNPWTVERGGLQSMVSQRVRNNLATEHAHKMWWHFGTVIEKFKIFRDFEMNEGFA